jgi:hypothetical protein
MNRIARERSAGVSLLLLSLAAAVGAGCDEKERPSAPVAPDCAAAQPLAGSFELDDQSALDALPIASEIQGDLTVRGGVTGLDHLGCLRSVTGSVTITATLSLASLRGLDQLESVGRDLRLEGNPALTDLDGLDHLTGAGKIFVDANSALRNVEGLRNLSSVDSLVIDDSPITTVAGLRGLNIVETTLRLRATRLTNLAGLENLVFGPQASVELFENAELSSLTGLSARVTSLLALSISGAAKLTDLTGLENVLDVGALDISRNAKLTSLGALQSLRSAPSFAVTDNVRLPACEARALATRVGAIYVTVTGNDASATCE